ncbi:FtsK/SpoIIIE domain-containing protein [Phycicoccus avicenniae]|uniref:FtsK/SpoIIIE domain-containing protein n=1 Tax=Phycicoccus avicenniae TaxID=2828860 RepID=UPI003D27F652
MEIRMTVHTPRRRPQPVEVVVRARRPEPVSTLRAALADHLGRPVEHLSVQGRSLPDEAVVGLPPLLDGVSLAVDVGDPRSAPPADATPSVLEIAAVAGPDAGRSLPLSPPGLVVGRSPTVGLRLDDPALSREHCRFDVGPDGVRVVDLGSTNGVEVDGRPVCGEATVDTASVVVLGSTTLRLRRSASPGMPVTHPGDGTAVVEPVPSPPPEPPAGRVVAPRAPEPPRRGRIPWVAALVPVPVVGVLALFFGPQVLAFALLGPVMVLSSGLGDRVGGRRRHRRELAEHRVALREHDERLAAALDAERRLRHLAHPDPHRVLALATHRGSGLWARPGDLGVRLGLGTTTARTRVVDEDGHEDGCRLRHAPVVVDLDAVGGLAVVGDRAVTGAVLASLVGQLVVRNPPSALALEHTAATEDWSWLDLLPHRGSGGGRRLLVVPDAAAPDVASAVAAVRSEGGIVLVAAPDDFTVPDACPVRALVVGGGAVQLTASHDEPTDGSEVVADGVGPAWRERLGRALAPVREGSRGGRSLPSGLTLPELLGPEVLTPAGVQARWSRSTGPTATVGVTADGPLALDLRRDGPHVLVGGTTGSGKSEFLRTLVTALSLDSPPEALSLLLVDFKGGAAFGSCADLPHVVGLVTDLDEHLVKRVLVSLEAELRRRERVLAATGAADLEDHRRRAAPEHRLPRLVVVVDELRALVDASPEAVSALVRLAAQGRSLGIHLVLATQRPAGTVTAEVQANVNLRLAFRVRDRADSVHVVEDESAALLPPDVPGRGVASGGDRSTLPFQAALVVPAAAEGPSLVVTSGLLTDVGPVARAEDRSVEVARVVDVIRRAHAGVGGAPPRRPWLPALPAVVAAAGVPPTAVALVDEPDRQRQVPWGWAPEASLWRVVGQPRSGRSTALARLVGAAAAGHPPGRLHVQVLASDPRALGLGHLPHVGTAAALDDPQAVEAVLDHLEQPPGPDDAALRLLVLDGWDRLVDAEDTRAPASPSERVLRLAREGARLGVRCVVSGGRDLLRPRWSGLGGEVLLLGPADPVDLTLLGLPAASGPRPPGRGTRGSDGREVQVALPPNHDPPPRGAAHGPRPWTYRPLPERVTRDVAAEGAPGWLVGVSAPSAEPWSWRPDLHGRRLLVLGPSRSGRSTTLAALSRSARADGRRVVLVRPGGRAEPAPDGVEVLGPDDAECLVAARLADPDLLVLVDDAPRLDDTAVAPVLDELESVLDDAGGALVVVTTPAALGARFRGLDVTVARHRSGLMLRPAPDDAPLLGMARTSVPADDRHRAPGRGVLVLDGRGVTLQVLTDEPAALVR